jgi:hypothetical protein
MIRDAFTALLLLNEARHRAVARVFGVTRGNANIVTILAIGALSEGLYRRATRVFGTRPHVSLAGTAIGAAGLNATAYRVAGGSPRTPFFGALLLFAVLGKSSWPMLRTSLREVRGAFRAVKAGSRRLLAFLGEQ